MVTFRLILKRLNQCCRDKNLKLIFICSPNNPTGNSMNSADVEYILANFNGIVVIDEAYIDFSNKPSYLKLGYRYSNLILMQTFSKAYGLAGIRIGMAFSDPEILQYFNKMKPPYNISTINQRAALAKLKKAEEYKNQIVKIKNERKRVKSNLLKLQFC